MFTKNLAEAEKILYNNKGLNDAQIKIISI